MRRWGAHVDNKLVELGDIVLFGRFLTHSAAQYCMSRLLVPEETCGGAHDGFGVPIENLLHYVSVVAYRVHCADSARATKAIVNHSC